MKSLSNLLVPVVCGSDWFYTYDFPGHHLEDRMRHTRRHHGKGRHHHNRTKKDILGSYEELIRNFENEPVPKSADHFLAADAILGEDKSGVCSDVQSSTCQLKISNCPFNKEKSDVNYAFSRRLCIEGFHDNEVQVFIEKKGSHSVLLIEASHEDTLDGHTFVSRAFTRRFVLPWYADTSNIAVAKDPSEKHLSVRLPAIPHPSHDTSADDEDSKHSPATPHAGLFPASSGRSQQISWRPVDQEPTAVPGETQALSSQPVQGVAKNLCDMVLHGIRNHLNKIDKDRSGTVTNQIPSMSSNNVEQELRGIVRDLQHRPPATPHSIHQQVDNYSTENNGSQFANIPEMTSRGQMPLRVIRISGPMTAHEEMPQQPPPPPPPPHVQIDGTHLDEQFLPTARFQTTDSGLAPTSRYFAGQRPKRSDDRPGHTYPNV